MAGQESRFYEFGHFRLDAEEGMLWRDGRPVPLTPKAFAMLLLLVKNSGHLVRKEELMERIWPDTFVEEANLTNNISLLRKVLEGEPAEQQFIQTIPKRGYKFVAAVSGAPGEGTSDVPREGIPAEKELGGSPRRKSFFKGRFPSARIQAVTSRQRATLALALAGLLVLLAFAAVKRRVWLPRKPALNEIQSVAVLPLDNVSGDAGQDYFADAMTDTLINELAQISALRVISRTSVMTYKGVRKPVPEIGRELNVDAVIEGSVIRSGARVRISVKLIEAATDRHLWAKSYERELRDILALQSEIGRDVAGEIEIKLKPHERMRLASARPVNPEAHEAYLKGLYLFNQGINERSAAVLGKSSEYFGQAINLDPTYAPAHAGLSRSYHWVASYGVRPQELFPKAKEAALRAIELDESDADAHASLGYIYFNYEWDWDGAERELRRALELNPNLAYHAYGLYLSAVGRHEEAVSNIKRAEEVDPLTIPLKRNVGLILVNARRYDQAIAQFLKVLELKPDDPMSLLGLGRAYAYKGMYEEAVAATAKAVELSGGGPDSRLAWVYALSGRKEEAGKILDELERRWPQLQVLPENMAAAYAALGDKDHAFAWLERAYEERSQVLVYLKVTPRFDGLRSDARYTDLLRRIRLTP